MNWFRLMLLAWSTSLIPAHALIMVGEGNIPVSDPGWPSGALDVANLPSRIGWWEGPPFGGGEWHFEFKGTTETFQGALNAFSKIDAPVVDLFVHDGTQISFVLDPNHTTPGNGIDWTFTIWVPERWRLLYGESKPILISDDPNAGKPMPGPRIDLFLTAKSKIDFDQVIRPAKVHLHDERARTAGVDTASGSVFRIQVTDLVSGLAIPGAQVHVNERDGKGQYSKPLTNTMADGKGIALISPLAAGVFQISATAPGYVEAAVAYGDYPDHSFKRFEVSLAKSGSVTGTVVDESGKGVPAIHLVTANTLIATNVPYRPLEKPQTTTDQDGRFTLNGLPVGLVQLWVQSTNYFQTNIFQYQSVPGTGISIGVRASGSLLVQVMDVNGQGVQQFHQQPIQVSASPRGGAIPGSWGGSANVGNDGACLFTGVHPGTYTIKVLNANQEKRVTVAAREQAKLVFQLP